MTRLAMVLAFGALVAAGAGPADDEKTPVGATRAGNAEGTIPEWTGGLPQAAWPKDYGADKRLADPFAQDRPLFVVTAQNLREHAPSLSEGHKMLFAKYPDYRLPIYATHRIASFPREILEATQANANTARLGGPDRLEGARLGFPFPAPRSGVEAMWNHRVRYRGDSLETEGMDALVPPDGSGPAYIRKHAWKLFRYANVRNASDPVKDRALLYTRLAAAESRTGAFTIFNLAHDSIDAALRPRRFWAAGADGRWVRAPHIDYDMTVDDAGGLVFFDMLDMYNGAFDRYTWKLLGKRELYVPYDSYRLNDGSHKYKQLLTPKFFNPDAARYELHRVWVIEATLLPEQRHAFGKRVFYLDEDSWSVVLVENYDPAGKPWRFQEAHVAPNYAREFMSPYVMVTHDFRNGQYYAGGLMSEEPPPRYDLQRLTERDFLPSRPVFAAME